MVLQACRQTRGVLPGQQCTRALLSECLPVPGLSSAFCGHFLLASSQPSRGGPVSGCWVETTPPAETRPDGGTCDRQETGWDTQDPYWTTHRASSTHRLMEFRRRGLQALPTPSTEVTRSLAPAEQRERESQIWTRPSVLSPSSSVRSSGLSPVPAPCQGLGDSVCEGAGALPSLHLRKVPVSPRLLLARAISGGLRC